MDRKNVVQQIVQMKPNAFKGTNMDEDYVGDQEPNGAVMTSSREYYGIWFSSDSNGIFQEITV